MEQRPLRLGDIVDDYCPRERRITNHAIVAVVDQSIKQTRCTTCDAEHAYKDAKVPRRRKKEDAETLYEEVLTEVTSGQLVTKGDQRPSEPAPIQAAAPAAEPPATNSTPSTKQDAPAEAEPAVDDREREPESWFVHRTLIRATLPRVEGGDPPPRPIPEFTMHQRQGRGGQGFRYGQGWPNGNGNGNSNGHGRNGFRQGRDGQGQGHGQGHSGGGGRHGRHRGRHKQPK